MKIENHDQKMQKSKKEKKGENDQEFGKIKLIIGPMFSGKSTRLIETVRKYSFKNKKTILINFIGDNRYTSESQIVTHDQIKYDSIQCQYLNEKISMLENYDVIGIDEGQFFSDLIPICEQLCFKGKIVVVAALSGDFLMKPFPNVAELISKADKIKLMKAYCFYCHKVAGFSLRIVDSQETILIGASEAYRPVCKGCYYKYNNLKKNEVNACESDENVNLSNCNENHLNGRKVSKGKVCIDDNGKSISTF